MFLFDMRTRSANFDSTRRHISSVIVVVVVLALSVVCRRLDAASVTSTSTLASSLTSSSATVMMDSSQWSAPTVDGVTSTATPPIHLADETTSVVTERSNSAARCALFPIDSNQHEIIMDMVTYHHLIQYVLVFPNSSVNPLTQNLTVQLKGNKFSRVSSSHGQTLLSLAFNYGILSLKTLTIGTDETLVALEERPVDCLQHAAEHDKLNIVIELLLRDFKTGPGSNPQPHQPTLLPQKDDFIDEVTTNRDELRICYERVTDNGMGYARFSNYCCHRERYTGEIKCDDQYPNSWLKFLYVMLTCIRFGVLAFGPLMFLSAVSGLVREEFPYTVNLKDPLIKTIVVYRTNSGGIGQPLPAIDVLKGTHKLDLRNQNGFPKLGEMLMNNPELIGQPFRAKFKQYDVLVSYKRLLTENKVPVGFWRSIVRAVFFCKLRHVGPFQNCCRTDIFRQRHCRRTAEVCCGKSAVRGKVQWIQIWRRVGLALLILLLPSPYYVRLFILYFFEYDEVITRKEAAHRLGLREFFDNSFSFVHYFLPTSPLFIVIYVVYLLMAINLAYLARRTEKGRFRKIIIGSFTDLKNLSWLNVLNMMVSNVIWPFRRYGVAGCLVALVYWPIVLPLTSLVYAFYCLPTVYLTVRMFFYSKLAFLRKIDKRSAKRAYQVKHKVDDSVKIFEFENLISSLIGKDSDDEDEASRPNSKDAEEARRIRRSSYERSASTRSTGWPTRFSKFRESTLNSDELDNVSNVNSEKVPSTKRSDSNASLMITVKNGCQDIILHCMASALCVATLYAVLIVLSECVGCLVEIFVFTLMGIIVNAGTLLKYVALTVMLIVYSYECFNNVEKKYLKLNRALFAEVKGRVKDLDKITSQPSILQENCGFKSQELGEQATYELSDDVIDKPSRHWRINDLVLFVDNEDMPRIPRKLFDDVCRIRVAGVPGPVYRGQLMALRQFFRIVIFIFFVFVVILSFSSITKVSNTNQMLAALAGGSLPFILRMVMEPEKPDIEIGTVSFKSQLDEVIKNFVQYWPIYDLPFEVYTAEDEEHDRKLAEEKKQKEGGRSGGGGGGGDGGTLERQKNVDGARVGSIDRGQAVTISCAVNVNNNVDDCVDGAVDSSHIGNSHVVIRRERETSVGDRPPDVAETSKARVCFGGDLNDEPAPKPEVDIVIYLPEKFEMLLEQQSSNDDVDLTDEANFDDAEVFALNETPQERQRNSNVTTTAKGVDEDSYGAGTPGQRQYLLRM